MAEDIRKMENMEGKKSFLVEYKQPHCVVLDSAYCSMGRMIGNKACEKAGYTYYDAVILLESIPDCKFTKDDVDRIEAKYRSRIFSKEEVAADTELAEILEVFRQAVEKALAKGPCLIHDRATKEMVEAMGYSCVSAFTTVVNEDYQIERAQSSPLYREMTDRQEILDKIEEENRVRYNIHQLYSDAPWGEAKSYDLILNTDLLGRDYCSVVLSHVMKAD